MELVSSIIICICVVPCFISAVYYRAPYYNRRNPLGPSGYNNRRPGYNRDPVQSAYNRDPAKPSYNREPVISPFFNPTNPAFNIPGLPSRGDDSLCSVNGPNDIRRLLPGRFMSESQLMSMVPASFNKDHHKPAYTSLKRIVVSRFTESGFSKPGTSPYINDGICGCCVTELSYEIMNEITDFNGNNHTIINFNNSYQFIPSGKCANENAPCAGGTARCKQVTRAHWSLVWTPSVGARLVSHEVPSHCQCINLGASTP